MSLQTKNRLPTLKEQLIARRKPVGTIYVPFYYPEVPPVAAFELYGWREDRDLRESNPGITLGDIIRYGYEDWPVIDINTVEFMAIAHENGLTTVISSQSGGFFYNFLVERSEFLNNLQNYYIEMNGEVKQMVLQQVVK